MDLKYEELKAFITVNQLGSLTKAAIELGLSQPALSQRIARIEETLQSTVFIRKNRTVILTETGEKLLRFAKEAISHRHSFMENFDQYQNELRGSIRIAGFSSIMRSMIIPRLTPFLKNNLKARVIFSSHEMFDLEEILKTNQADFILTDYFPNIVGTKQTQIAEEEYVIIKSKRHKKIPHIFLDHGPKDNATASYFDFLKEKKDYQRAYMGEVYAIIDAVACGLGKAVMSKHLIEQDKRFVIEKKKKKYVRPVVLTYFEQNYYSPLHEEVLLNLLKLSTLPR